MKQDPRCRMHDARCRVQDARHKMDDAGYGYRTMPLGNLR
jgi:hypothetical protein